MPAVETVVKEMLHEVTGADHDRLLAEAHFRNNLQMDDLSLIDLVMKVEDVLDITISDHDAEGLQTVGDLISLAQRKVGE